MILLRAASTTRRGAPAAAAFLVAVAMACMAGRTDAATYYLRADGAAADKTAATSDAAAATAMSVATHNAQAFAPDDVIRLSERGGVYKDSVIAPSSGTDGHPIVYTNAPGQSPLIDLSVDVGGTGWSDMGGGVYSKSGYYGRVLWEDDVPLKAASGTACADGGWYYPISSYKLYYKPSGGTPASHTIRVMWFGGGGWLPAGVDLRNRSNITVVGLAVNRSGCGITHGQDLSAPSPSIRNIAICSNTVTRTMWAVWSQVTSNGVESDVSICDNLISYCNSGISAWTCSDTTPGHTQHHARHTVARNQILNLYSITATQTWSDALLTSYYYTDHEGISFQDAQDCSVVDNLIHDTFIQDFTSDEYWTRAIYFFLTTGNARTSGNTVYRNQVLGGYAPAIYVSGAPVSAGGFESNAIACNRLWCDSTRNNYSAFQVNMYAGTNAATGTNSFLNNTICYTNGGVGINLSGRGGNWIVRNNLVQSRVNTTLGSPVANAFVFDHNLYVFDMPALRFMLGASSMSLATWRASGYDTAGSFAGDPGLASASGGVTAATSPAIDAGADVVQTVDGAGQKIYGCRDIGAWEYQPPHVVGVDAIDTGAGARIYGDGTFRDAGATNGSTADLAIRPGGGVFTASGSPVPAWLDVSVGIWDNTGTRHKRWSESRAEAGLTATEHAVGDVATGKAYHVTVDGAIADLSGGSAVGGDYVCQSDSQGKVRFTYTGGYGTGRVFDVQEAGLPSPASNLTGAVVSGDGVQLHWDDSDAETSYTLERRPVDGAFAPLQILAANTVSFTDSSALPGVSYEYRLRASNSSGDSDCVTVYVARREHALPYRESFEGFTNGTLLPGFEGWYGESATAAQVVTNREQLDGLQAYAQPVGYPLRAAAHAQVAYAAGAITNRLVAPVHTAVWSDMMAELVRMRTEPRTVPPDTHTALCLDSNGWLNVWHRDLVSGAGRWSTLDWHTGQSTVWARLTFNLDYATTDAVHNACFFRLYVDGALQSNALAFTRNDGGGAPGGSWFAMGTSAPDRVCALAITGPGALDDLVVDTARPLIGLGAQGTPEWWLADHGLTNCATLADDEQADADNDGFANWKEYAAGTDPGDPGSLLRFRAEDAATAGNRAPLTLETVAGRRYLLESCTNLPADAWAVAAFALTPTGSCDTQAVAATGSSLTVYVAQTGPVRFYRIRLAP